MQASRQTFIALQAAVLSLHGGWAGAASLAEDRADAMYHSFDGGGVEVSGPALSARKSLGEDWSISGTYYHDTISGASPDVLATASPYDEERNEYGLSVDYLYKNSVVSFGILNSDESDYQARAYSLAVAHDVFGGMTTLKFGFSRGDDSVGRSDTDFSDSIDRYDYSLGISQVLTKSLIVNVDYELIADEGFLANPYRSKRVLGTFAGPEIYPSTRTSNAVSVRALKSLQPGMSALFGYRYFWDTWEVTAQTVEAGYSGLFKNGWLLDVYYRYYTQEQASFYSDNFESELTYMARDKELSTYNSNTLGARFSYPLFEHRGGMSKGSMNVSYEVIDYQYDNYSDASKGGDDPYSFSADVLHIYFSIWY